MSIQNLYFKYLLPNGVEVEINKSVDTLSGAIIENNLANQCNVNFGEINFDGCVKFCDCEGLCVECPRPAVTNYNSISGNPNFLYVHISGADIISNGFDVNYTGNDISSAVDMIYDYGNGDVITYTNAVTSTNINPDVSYFYPNSTLEEGDIIPISISFVSDCGLNCKWEFNFEVPEIGNYGVASYIMPYITNIVSRRFPCESEETFFIEGGVTNINGFNINNITYAFNDIETNVSTIFDQGITTSTNNINFGINTFTICIEGTNPNGTPLTSKLTTDFKIGC